MKKWTKEQEQFLIDNKNIIGKQLITDMLNEKFGTDYSVNSVATKRSDLGATAGKRRKRKSKRPLYSERITKNYIYVKVADYPPKWIPKQKYIWMKNHPNETVEKNDVFIFLDMNNRNFDPENIVKVNRKVLSVINNHYTLQQNEVEKNKLRISMGTLSSLIVDRACECGLATVYKRDDGTVQRVFRSYQCEKAKEYREKRKNDCERNV